MPPAVDIRGLAYTYPDGRKALHGVDLRVEAGRRVALLGPNGAGKTTLALHVNGLLRPAAGSVAVQGLAVTGDNLAEIRRRVGLVFQDPDDQLFMPTVAEDVAFGPANLGLDEAVCRRRTEEALAAVGAGELAERAPHHLSGGEKRRVALAGVLAMQPDILVLDEPTSGLDPAGARELAGLLAGLPMTQLVVTHDLPFALELCPHAVIMSEGRVGAAGPTSELLADRRLLADHGLRLPFGFAPQRVSPPQ